MSEIDFLTLVDSCLCTSIRKVSRLITRIYDQFLDPSGLNINQLGLLLTIKGQNDKDEVTSIGNVGRRLMMEKSTLSRNIRKLEDVGLIVLDINPEHRSQKIAKLTEKGMKVVLEAYKYWDDVQQRIMSGFGEKKFTQLIGLLANLQQNMEREFATIL